MIISAKLSLSLKLSAFLIALALILGSTGTVLGDTQVIQVSTDNDDVEERVSDGHMYLNSSDLELVYGKDGTPDQHNGDEQIIGIRFNGVNIPAGAAVLSAYIQFQCDETTSSTCILTIHGEASDNPSVFTTATSNVSSRPTTTASVPWSPLAWNSANVAGVDQRTPDLSAVVGEIVGRGGWSSGNSMVFVITGAVTGTRIAEAGKNGTLTLNLEWSPLNHHVEFTQAESSGAEDGSTVDVEVQLTGGDPGATVTADYDITNISTASGDYTPYLGSGTVTFTDDTPQYISVTLLADSLAEGDEQLMLTLSNLDDGGASVGLGAISQHTVTIIDDSPTVSFMQSSSSGTESDGTVNIEVVLNKFWSDPVTVDYAINTSTSTATSPADFTLGGSGTLTFDVGIMSQLIPVILVDDEDEEFAETVIITLSNPSVNSSLGSSEHTFVIDTSDINSDWPQFMRNSENNGDAADEQLLMPLNLVSQIKLDDAVMNSPAVVGGLVYVVDQMGKAYCIDPDAEPAIVWESAPEGNAAYGSNTASPCVANGKVYFATTTGNVHILNAANGNLIRTVSFGSSIVSGLTWANDSLYFQTLDAIVYCLDSDGNQRWQWKKAGNIHYGGCVVAVSGTKVVTSVGSNMYCLDDMVTQAQLLWSTSGNSTRYVPTGISISDGYVYTTCSGSDGQGQVRRFSLANGAESVKDNEWAPMCTPAVRGTTMYYSRQAYGVTAYNFASGSAAWKSFTSNAGNLTPSVTSPALSQNHCVFTTSLGRLIAIDLAASGSGLNALSIAPFIFQPPHNQAINSSPVISNGRVYFGCDDGYLYILGSGPAIQPVIEEPLDVHQRKSQVTIAGQRAYPSRGAFGDASNDGYIDDPGFKPPFKLKWAVPSYGTFKHPVCAGDDDIVYVTMSGLVTCREQMTGRLRWMTKLEDQGWSRESLLVGENGKIYVPRSLSPRYNKVNGQPNGLYCLDGDTGEILWMQLMGTSNWQRSSPILLDGVVAYGSLLNGAPVIHRWNADTGEPLPDIIISSSGSYVEGAAGCAADGLMFFTGGGSGSNKSGETMAIVPATGEIIWRTDLPWGSRTSTPVYQAGKLYLSGAYQQSKFCLDASDGTILWENTQDIGATLVHAASVGPDYLVVAHKYEHNKTNRFNLSDGVDTGINLWATSHGCGSIVLGSEGFAMSAGINGICIKDSTDGSILWTSGGFTASTCPHPAVTNGRIFYCPQDDGMLYCFEPEQPEQPVIEHPGDMDDDYDVDMGDLCAFAGLFLDLDCPEAPGCWLANLASPGQVGFDDLEAFVGYWLTDYCTPNPETAIINGPDDVEQTNHNGYMYFDSSDLELINDNRTNFGDQTIGLRFNDIKFKQGTVVDLAYIQFTAKDATSGDCSLTIKAQDSDNALNFSTADFDLTNRPTTTANVQWNPPAWIDGDAGPNQQTPNLAALITQVLARSDWKCGNSLAFVINGTGLRRAYSFDGSNADAPRLYISTGSGGVPMVATMPATNITDNDDAEE